MREHLRPYVDRGTISKYALPETVILVDRIDKTSVGKIDKKALRAKYSG
jgi:non-ribosomal peptide synthetase component E (peptide arylation enzyme)